MRRLEKPESLTMQEPDEKSGLCVFAHTTAQQNRIENFRTWSTESWSLNQIQKFRFGLRLFQTQKSGFRSRKIRFRKSGFRSRNQIQKSRFGFRFWRPHHAIAVWSRRIADLDSCVPVCDDFHTGRNLAQISEIQSADTASQGLRDSAPN